MTGAHTSWSELYGPASPAVCLRALSKAAAAIRSRFGNDSPPGCGNSRCGNSMELETHWKPVPMEEGRPAPLGCVRDRPPAVTCLHTHADRRARLRQTMLLPVDPLRSIRRSQGRGVSRSIALHTCQLLGPTVPYPDTSAIRSRRPAVPAFASESHLRSPGGISGPAGHPDGVTGA